MRASILINNYNYGLYLNECLKSCLNNRVKNLEIIVYDDKSTDNSISILKQFKNKIIVVENNFSKSIHNSENQLNAIKRALDLSKGEIVFLLDSDDYFKKDKIKTVLEIYEKRPEIEAVHDSMIFLDNNKMLKQKYISSFSDISIDDFVKFSGYIYSLGPQTSALSFKRTYLYDLINRYNKDLNLIWPDLQLGRKSILEKKGIVLKDYLTVRRIHKSSDSQKLKSVQFSNQVKKQLVLFYGINSNRKNSFKSLLLAIIYSIKKSNFFLMFFLIKSNLNKLIR